MGAEQEKANQVSDLKLKLKEPMGSQKNNNFDDKSSQGSTKINASNSLLRREFKISGSIGYPHQSNILTFFSLIHQIEAAVSKGYSDSEII